MKAFAALVALAAAPACSSESPADACARYFAALASGPCQPLVIAPSDAQAIEASFVRACENEMALDGSSLTPASLDACTSLISSAGCIPLETMYGPCAAAPGALPTGAACESDAQCASTRCNSPPGECGTCVDSLPEGSACDLVGAPCVAGTACFDGTCTGATFAASGESCDDDETFCQSGLVCTGTCGPPVAEGGACFRGSDCAVGLVCSDQGTCVEGSRPAFGGVGAACDEDTPCLAGFCTNGTCPAPLADGAACDPASGPPCGAFSLCTAGTCQPEFSAHCGP